MMMHSAVAVIQFAENFIQPLAISLCANITFAFAVNPAYRIEHKGPHVNYFEKFLESEWFAKT